MRFSAFYVCYSFFMFLQVAHDPAPELHHEPMSFELYEARRLEVKMTSTTVVYLHLDFLNDDLDVLA